jgi:hypothetical protein
VDQARRSNRLHSTNLEVTMNDDGRHAMLEARLAEAEAHLATVPRGTVANQDALSAVRHLERVILGGDGLPPMVNPHGRRHLS